MHGCRLVWIHGLSVLLILTVSPIWAADYAQYLPDDTEFVIHANISQALDSGLAKKYLLPQIEETLKGKSEIREILTALGLDPLKDLQSLTIALPGKVSEKKWTALIQGQFDQSKIQTTGEAFGSQQAGSLKSHKEGGATIFEFQDAKHSQSAFAAFVDQSALLVASTKDPIRNALAKKDPTKPSSLNKDLLALMKEGSDKESLWLALVPDQVIKTLPQNNKQVMDIANKVKSIKGGITVTDGIKFSVRIQTPDAKAARDIRQTLVGIQSILILAVTSNDQLKEFGPTLTDIINSIKFTLDKSAVGVDLNVTAKQIEEGLKK
jgi:hypothetical protein